MTWSTRELADLAGTTVNTIRHYHSLGLLDAPDRRYNGYKQYRVCHLVRLLQVRRIAELGVPLAQVEAAGDDSGVLHDGLRQLDTDVACEIERLHRTRSDIAAILLVHAPVDAPRGFEAIAAELSEADSALIHILTTVGDEDDAASLREMVAIEPVEVRREFDALREDADEDTRRRVSDRVSAAKANWRSAERPWLTNDIRRRSRNAGVAREAISEALNELYNIAQRDVLRRVADATARAAHHRTASEATHRDTDLLICA